MRKLLVLLVGIAGAAGCVPEANYYFRPAEQVTARIGGRPAARYAIPPESPRGSARVASCGIREIQTSSGEVRMLHVRLVIANNNDSAAWTLDPRELRVIYASGEGLAPVLVNGRGPDVTHMEIAPGEAGTIDAYFPLPEDAEGAESIPRFDLSWEVSTPEREVAERTPFERIRIEPEGNVNTAFGAGPWPMWWYDQSFFASPPLIVGPRPRVIIVRPRRR